MKKFAAMAAAAGLCIAMALAGCGGSEPTKKADSAAKVLKVGTEATFPPFESYQEKTKAYTGFDVELVDIVAKNMGYDKVEFVDTKMGTILDDLNAGKFDVAMRCLAITDARKEKVNFTDPYLVGAYAVVAKKGYSGSDKIDALDGKKIAVEKDSAPEKLLQEMKYTNFAPVASNEEGIKAVAAGDADFAVMSRFTAAFYVSNGYEDEVTVIPGLLIGNKIPIGFAVRKEDSNLHAKLNAALTEYRWTTTFDQLKKSYFGDMV